MCWCDACWTGPGSRGWSCCAARCSWGECRAAAYWCEGFEHRAAMTMMPYNYPYYARLLESLGFRKHVDLFSMDLPPAGFQLPERVRAVAEKVLARGRFRVLLFRSKREIRRVADQIAGLYNETLADHLEDYPLSEAELEQVKKDLLVIADPRLVKILTYDGAIVGYLSASATFRGPCRRTPAA